MRATFTIPPEALATYRRDVQRRLEKAALAATAITARTALREVRTAMSSRRLGKLGNAIGTTSDQAKGGQVYREGNGFSASGVVHLRTRSKRTVGAIEAYTEGAEIRPRRGRFLWMATLDLQKRAKGGKRMTPEEYVAGGYEQRIGPLEFFEKGGKGYLGVRDVSVQAPGMMSRKRRGVRPLPKRGALGPTRLKREMVVLFVGIRRTGRAARVDATGIFQAAQRRLPEVFGTLAEGEGGRRR